MSASLPSSLIRPIPDQARAALLASFMAAGAERSRANEAVDLACHACETAMAQLIAVSDRSADPGVKLMVLEVGAQLIATHAQHLFQTIHQACGDGLRTAAVEVQL